MVVTVGPVVNIIPTLGEELGWRGYLMPKLRELVSDRAALIITGIIWGFWHLPVIVMGHNYGTAYAGYPYLGILQMVVFCVSLGVIEGYASIKLNSAIPAAMIHSTVNAGAGLAVFFAKTGYNPLLGPAITGLVGGLPFTILAVVLLVRLGQTADMKEVA
jgi:membrane protease YdiL (CAAX protease family)